MNWKGSFLNNKNDFNSGTFLNRKKYDNEKMIIVNGKNELAQKRWAKVGTFVSSGSFDFQEFPFIVIRMFEGCVIRRRMGQSGRVPPEAVES